MHSNQVLSYVQGQTDSITCAAFLPGTGGRLLVSAGPSKDVRCTAVLCQGVLNTVAQCHPTPPEHSTKRMLKE